MVVDASVAAQWFLNEPGSAAARRIAGTQPLLAPDFVLAECYHAVWKRWTRGEASDRQLEIVVPRLRDLFDELTALADLLEEAAELGRLAGHPIYDCLYVVLARRRATVLVTADERQRAMAQRAGVRTERP